MVFKLLDRARMSVSGTPGTGDITLGAAATGYQSFAQAGVSNGDSFPYAIKDNTAWEYGVATYASSGNKLTRTVTKSSLQSSSPISLSSTAVISAVIRAEDIAQVTSLVGLADVSIPTQDATVDGWALVWKNADLKFELAAITYANLPDKPTIPTNSGFFLYQLGDTSMSPGPFVDGYVVTWSNTANKFILSPTSSGASLTALSDVTISAPANGDALIYNSGTSKWANASVPGGAVSSLTDVTLTSLATNQILRWNGSAWVNIAIPAQALVSLSDVQVTTGAGVDGYSVTWSNGLGKFVLTNVSGGGGGSLAGLSDVNLTSPANTEVLTYDSGTSKWINAPASGGGGGSTMTPPVSTNFTAVTNLNSATLTDRASGAIPSLHVKPGSGSNGDGYCILQAAPGGNFSIVVKVQSELIGTATGWNGAGLMLYNSSGTKAAVLWMTASNGPALWSATFSGGLTSGSPALGTACADGDYFLHADYDGTNVILGISRNGLDKLVASTVTLASFLGAITHVGVFWSGSASGMEHDFLHWHAGALGTSGL